MPTVSAACDCCNVDGSGQPHHTSPLQLLVGCMRVHHKAMYCTTLHREPQAKCFALINVL